MRVRQSAVVGRRDRDCSRAVPLEIWLEVNHTVVGRRLINGDAVFKEQAV